MQNTQHNLQGKDSDEDMQERINEYIENGDVGDGDAIVCIHYFGVHSIRGGIILFMQLYNNATMQL